MVKFDNNKRYYTLDSFFKQKFGNKVVKIALDIGATCPNLDGTLSTTGCSYCSAGSGDFAFSGNIVDAFYKGIELIKDKWPNALYMPYFQSFTNTYMSVTRLKSKVDQVINMPNVIGISISTRPDCIDDQMLEYLSNLSKETYLIVELGMQTSNDETLKLCNRGHNYKTFKDMYYKLKDKGINVCIHIIDGLINETKDDMINTIHEVSKLHPEFLKIHLMYFEKGTLDSERLEKGLIKPLSKEEYLDILVSQLELLPPDIALERLTGDGNRETLIAPKYSMDKKGMLSAIDNALRDRDTYQGKLYKNI